MKKLQKNASESGVGEFNENSATSGAHGETAFFETGRSMVEMLGVLAVIGVLSIGGIAGYKYGMDRYQANQILYEMNLTSAQLAMQLQRDISKKTTLSLNDPYESGKMSTVKFPFMFACGNDLNHTGHSCEVAGETGFYLIVSKVPESVCKMIKGNVIVMQYYSDMLINNDKDQPCALENEIAAFFDIEYGGPSGKPAEPNPSNPDTPQTPNPNPNPETPAPSVVTNGGA